MQLILTGGFQTLADLEAQNEALQTEVTQLSSVVHQFIQTFSADRYV